MENKQKIKTEEYDLTKILGEIIISDSENKPRQEDWDVK